MLTFVETLAFPKNSCYFIIGDNMDLIYQNETLYIYISTNDNMDILKRFIRIINDYDIEKIVFKNQNAQNTQLIKRLESEYQKRKKGEIIIL